MNLRAKKSVKAELVLSVLSQDHWLTYRQIHFALNGAMNIGEISNILYEKLKSKIEYRHVYTGPKEWQHRTEVRLK